MIDGSNMKISSSNQSAWPVVQPKSHALHMLTVKMVLPYTSSVQSPNRHMWWWLTPGLQSSSGEKWLIPQSISIGNSCMKAWSGIMTTTAIQHHTQRYMKCCIHLVNQHKCCWAWHVVWGPSTQPTSIWMLHQVTCSPGWNVPWHVQPEIKTLHNSRPQTRPKDIVEDMDPLTSVGENPIRSYLQQLIEYTPVESAWKHWNLHIWITWRFEICPRKRWRRWASPT